MFAIELFCGHRIGWLRTRERHPTAEAAAQANRDEYARYAGRDLTPFPRRAVRV